MTRCLLRLILAVPLAACLFAAPLPVSACSVAPTPTATPTSDEEYRADATYATNGMKDASAVFQGRAKQVTRMLLNPAIPNGSYSSNVTFAVDAVWKGRVGHEVTVLVPTTSCGNVIVDKNEEYIVFANGSGNGPLDFRSLYELRSGTHGQNVRKALGSSAAPMIQPTATALPQPSSGDATSSALQWFGVIALMLLVSVGFVGLVFVARRL